MRKFFSVIAPILGLAVLALAASPRVIDDGSARATLLALASGVFTIALAAHIRE